MNKKIVPPVGEWEVVEVIDSKAYTLTYSVVEVRNQGKYAIAVSGSVNGTTRKAIMAKTLCDKPIVKNEHPSDEEWLAHSIANGADAYLMWNVDSMIYLNSVEILNETAFWASSISRQADDLRHGLMEGRISRKENIDGRKKLEDEKLKFMDDLLQRRREGIQSRLEYTGKKQLSNMFIGLSETYEELKFFIKDYEPTIKIAKKTITRKIDWKSMVRDAPLPQTVMNVDPDAKFPDDLLMRLDDPLNWSDELKAKMQKHEGASTASDIALEWACRLCSFDGYERHSLNIRQLRKILKKAKAKNRGTDMTESVP